MFKSLLVQKIEICHLASSPLAKNIFGISLMSMKKLTFIVCLKGHPPILHISYFLLDVDILAIIQGDFKFGCL